MCEDSHDTVEFRWSLDRQSVNWYSQHEEGEFKSFKQLTNKFLKLFHRQVPKRELMNQFYAAYQEAHEIVPQFIIQFQTLWRQLARPSPEEVVRDTFLSAL